MKKWFAGETRKQFAFVILTDILVILVLFWFARLLTGLFKGLNLRLTYAAIWTIGLTVTACRATSNRDKFLHLITVTAFFFILCGKIANPFVVITYTLPFVVLLATGDGVCCFLPAWFFSLLLKSLFIKKEVKEELEQEQTNKPLSEITDVELNSKRLSKINDIEI